MSERPLFVFKFFSHLPEEFLSLLKYVKKKASNEPRFLRYAKDDGTYNVPSLEVKWYVRPVPYILFATKTTDDEKEDLYSVIDENDELYGEITLEQCEMYGERLPKDRLYVINWIDVNYSDCGYDSGEFTVVKDIFPRDVPDIFYVFEETDNDIRTLHFQITPSRDSTVLKTNDRKYTEWFDFIDHSLFIS